MQRQQFVHRPAMVCGSLPPWQALSLCMGQTFMRSPKVIHCAHHKHPLVQGQRRASAQHRRSQWCERSRTSRSAAQCTRCIDHAVSATDGGSPRRRAIDNAAFGRDHMPPLVVFDDFMIKTWRHARSRPSAHAHVHGIAKRLLHGADVDTKPSVQTGRGADMPHSA